VDSVKATFQFPLKCLQCLLQIYKTSHFELQIENGWVMCLSLLKLICVFKRGLEGTRSRKQLRLRRWAERSEVEVLSEILFLYKVQGQTAR